MNPPGGFVSMDFTRPNSGCGTKCTRNVNAEPRREFRTAFRKLSDRLQARSMEVFGNLAKMKAPQPEKAVCFKEIQS